MMERRRVEHQEMSKSYGAIVEDARTRHFTPAITAQEAMDKYTADARPCPQCGAQPRELRWLPYSTPGTWERLTITTLSDRSRGFGQNQSVLANCRCFRHIL